jgi:hypothetical protein
MARVIGIDVSKLRLDAYSLEDGRRLAVGNDAAGSAALADQLGLSARDLLVMEASSGYERTAHRHLSARGLRVAIVNAARVRNFARASSCLAKTDRVDAAVIARYGAFGRPAPTPLLTGARQILAELLAYRRQLTAEITARGQQLGHLVTLALRQRAEAALERLWAERREITRLIGQTIAGDRDLAATATLLRSMPASGPCWSPPCSPSCPSSVPSTAVRSPAWSGWRRSPRTAAPDKGAARSAAVAAGSARHSTWPRSSPAAAIPPCAPSMSACAPTPSRPSSPWSSSCARCWSPSMPCCAPPHPGANFPQQHEQDGC